MQFHLGFHANPIKLDSLFALGYRALPLLLKEGGPLFVEEGPDGLFDGLFSPGRPSLFPIGSSLEINRKGGKAISGLPQFIRGHRP